MRQPLRRAVVVANEDERAAIEARADLVTAELNVKELDFVSDEGDLVSYEVKPNYRALGPRFGKRMPQVAAAVAALDAAHVASTLAEGGEVGISIDGADHTLGPDDLTMALKPLEGYEVEAEAGHAVALQLEIDEELRREGLAREIVRAVQLARKEAGLEITDRIALGLAGDAELLEVAREHEAYIAGETLATQLRPRRRRRDGARRAASSADDDRRPRAADLGPPRFEPPRRAAAPLFALLLAALCVALPSRRRRRGGPRGAGNAPAKRRPGNADRKARRRRRRRRPGRLDRTPAAAAHPRRLVPLRRPRLRTADPRPRAIAAGFVPHYVTYPLDNLPAAVEQGARRSRAACGKSSALDRVYAYGSSAGGTLAALLSGDDLVSAAVAKAPVSDLATWEWPTGKYGPEYWEHARRRPRRPRTALACRCAGSCAPLLVIQGRGRPHRAAGDERSVRRDAIHG